LKEKNSIETVFRNITNQQILIITKEFEDIKFSVKEHNGNFSDIVLHPNDIKKIIQTLNVLIK